MFDHCCVLSKRSNDMGRIDPQCFDHLANGMLPFYALVFLDYFCDRFCGAAVNHGVTWYLLLDSYLYAISVSSEIIYLF